MIVWNELEPVCTITGKGGVAIQVFKVPNGDYAAMLLGIKAFGKSPREAVDNLKAEVVEVISTLSSNLRSYEDVAPI